MRVACEDAGRGNGQIIACIKQAQQKNSGESAESLGGAQRLSEQCVHPFALIREHQIFALLRSRPATASETEREYLEYNSRELGRCARFKPYIGFVSPLMKPLMRSPSERRYDDICLIRLGGSSC